MKGELMFGSTKEPTELERARDDALMALRGLEPDSAEYKKTLKSVKELEALIATRKPERPSADALVKAAALVGTTLIIVAFEKSNV
ncbi:MAG: hypothetical protein ACWGQW_12765, partial [bacterium]